MKISDEIWILDDGRAGTVSQAIGLAIDPKGCFWRPAGDRRQILEQSKRQPPRLSRD